MATRETVVELLAMACAVAGKDTPSEPVLRLWTRLLAAADDDEVARAFESHLSTSKWMPAPAEILRLCGQHPEDVAQERWATIWRAATKVGRYASVDFGAEANAAIKALGGWVRLCEAPEDEVQHTQRHFLAAYSAARHRALRPEEAGHCVGLAELDAQRLGQAPEAPVRMLPRSAQAALGAGGGS